MRRRSLLLCAALLGVACTDGAEPDDRIDDTGSATDDTDQGSDTDCDWEYYRDADEDGFGDPLDAGSGACEVPEGYVLADGDCDDQDASINPDADEICGDGIDNDCDDAAPACRLEGELDLASASSALIDDETGEAFGTSVALVPDVDGDGRADLLVGRPGDDRYRPGNGWVGLYAGVGRDLSGQVPIATFRRRKDNENLGAVVLGGELVGEAGTDLVLAAPRAQRGSSEDVGAVHIVADVQAGPEVDLAFAPGLVWLGSERKDQAGRTVVAPGDVDGDGTADLAIGAPQPTGTKPGRVYLVSGDEGGDLADDADGEIVGGSSDQRVGDVLAAVGDVDGDGRGDLVVGGGSRSGASTTLWLFVDVPAATLQVEDADARLDGGTRVTLQQGVVSGAGDVDDDGYDDILVGAPALADPGDQEGAVYYFRGALESEPWSLDQADGVLQGTDIRQHLGHAVLGGQDLDHDGVPDVVASAVPTSDPGQIHVVYGPLDGTVDASDAVLTGTSEERRLGAVLAAEGDLDGDGWEDLAVGAPGYLGDDGRVILIWGQQGL